jgi:phenylalanyl-tRNA synthetase beta chain
LDVRGDMPGRVRVSLRTSRLNAVLGSNLDDSQVAGYLEPIGFDATVSRAGELQVTVPSFRPDTTREIDVIEEVARHNGYGSLPRRTPRPSQVGLLTETQIARRKLRNVLRHTGANEAWTPSLIAPGDHERVGLAGADITVANPLNPDESVLRRSLLPGMLRALAFNLNRRQAGVRLFEVGNVFPVPDKERVDAAMLHADPALTVVDEREQAGLLLGGPGDDATSAVRAWRALSDAMGIEGVDIEHLHEQDSTAAGLHPTRSASLVVSTGAEQGQTVGELGEIDPEVLGSFGVDSSRGRVGWLVIDFGQLLAVAPLRSIYVTPVSRFPSADIDLAFVVPDDEPANAVEQTLRASGGELLEKVWLFDVFRGPGITPGERSLAYRLRFCAPDRTLTDEEVAQLRAKCIATVEKENGARIRA